MIFNVHQGVSTTTRHILWKIKWHYMMLDMKIRQHWSQHKLTLKRTSMLHTKDWGHISILLYPLSVSNEAVTVFVPIVTFVTRAHLGTTCNFFCCGLQPNGTQTNTGFYCGTLPLLAENPIHHCVFFLFEWMPLLKVTRHWIVLEISNSVNPLIVPWPNPLHGCLQTYNVISIYTSVTTSISFKLGIWKGGNRGFMFSH